MIFDENNSGNTLKTHSDICVDIPGHTEIQLWTHSDNNYLNVDPGKLKLQCAKLMFRNIEKHIIFT